MNTLPHPGRGASDKALNIELVAIQEKSDQGLCIIRLIGNIRRNENPRLVLDAAELALAFHGESFFLVDLCLTTLFGRERFQSFSILSDQEYKAHVMWQFVIPYLFNPNYANLGAKIAFIFFGLCFICLAYLWHFQPEIASRTYEELGEMFMKGIPGRQFKTYVTEGQRGNQAVKTVMGGKTIS